MDGDEAIDGLGPRLPLSEGAAEPSAARAGIAPASAGYQTSPAAISLFDPNRFFAAIAVLFWPLKFFPIVLIPALVLAGLTMFKHRNGITADLQRLLGEFSFIVHVLLSLLVINLGARLAMGAVVRTFGGAVHDFGLIFFLGIIPRFYVDRSSIPRLDRSGQLWAYGAPLVVRLGFFAFGTLAWATYRSSGTWAPSLALLISQAGVWSFLFAAMPFMPGDGYNWLAVYFRQPMLRQKALIALSTKLRGLKLPPSLRRDEVPMLIFFAIGFIFTIVAFGFAVMIVGAKFLTGSMQGVGFVIFLMLVAVFVAWYFSFRAMRPERLQQQVSMLLAAKAGEADAAEPQTAPITSPWRRRLMVGAGVSLALILAALLPYSYDPAGPFNILPTQTSSVITNTDGEVVDVTVHEGDWVNAGQVLGHLSASDQQRNVDLTREDLARAKTRLAQLQEKGSTSDRETVEEARSEIDRLRLQLDSDQAQLDRTTLRAPAAGYVTTPNPQFLTGAWLNAGDKFLQIEDTKVLDAEVEIPQDDIALIKPGAEVRLRPWSERNREIGGRVTGVAPSAVDGADENVRGVEDLAANARTLLPALTTRHELAATAANRNNDAVAVDEAAADAGILRRRAMRRQERAKLPLDNNTDSGGTVRVNVSVQNPGTLLRPNMTGYAKISGRNMTVGQAYFRLGIRFVTVELWSWVP